MLLKIPLACYQCCLVTRNASPTEMPYLFWAMAKIALSRFVQENGNSFTAMAKDRIAAMN